MTKQEMITWIDNASYEDLLRKWRFAPGGDPFFVDEIGKILFKSNVRKKR